MITVSTISPPVAARPRAGSFRALLALLLVLLGHLLPPVAAAQSAATAAPGWPGTWSSAARPASTVVPVGQPWPAAPARVSAPAGLAAPVVSSFSPTSGPAGTVVTVLGSGFIGATSLTLNGAALPSFTIVSDIQIVFVVPVGATSGLIGVVSPGGTAFSPGPYTITQGNPTNPVPVITSLSPPSVQPGVGAFTLVVNGTGFVPASVVSSTAPVSMTTYLSATQLRVELPPGAVIGTYPVRVTNPAPGGGTSAPFNFFVMATTGPAPTISGFTPASAVAGTLVTVTGTNFAGASSVLLNGVTVGSFTLLSANQLTFVVSSSASTGRIAVITPGGTATSATTLVVSGNPVNPLPTITSLSPPSVMDGAGAFTLILTGTGYLPFSTVTFNGFALPITYLSATQLSVQLPAGAVEGTYPVVVTNPAPGGGSSAPFNFIVTPAPQPTITSFTPASAVAGTLVTVTGTNFTNVFEVELNQVPVGNYAVLSSTQLSFVVTSSSSTGRIAIFTSGGQALSATDLVVTGNPATPLPVITGLQPGSVPPGMGAFTLLVNGTGFVPTSRVMSAAPVSMTTYLSPTRLSVDLPPGAVTGTYPVTVTNPAPGGGTSAVFNFYVTAAPAPAIASFSPTTGPVGTLVTITGANLGTTNQVRFNGAVASFNVVSPTQVTAIVPAGATTGVITLLMPQNSVSSSADFVVGIGTASQAESALAGLTVYPNPARELVTVTLPAGVASRPAAQVRDLTGRVRLATRLTAAGQLSLRGLPAGLYLLTIGEGAQAVTRKLLKN
ncbi:IPT/TIG domain-containing protein [Hymenobacter algoricola]|uniref:IPT/TIG domain-containing protein n=1 Tax=Hymenobacter algoricola TaxID=486267 RepID=A0ABP7MG27_9BACT